MSEKVEKSFLDDLKVANKKCKYEIEEIMVSHRTNIPVLDHLLGGKFIVESTGEEVIKLGLPAGSHTMIAGFSQSGKTTLAMQIAGNIARQFGGLSTVIHFDKEGAHTYKRTSEVTAIPIDELKEMYYIKKSDNTLESFLEEVENIVKVKKGNPKYKYNTKQKDIWGNEIKYYVPTFIIMDSLMAINSRKEEEGELGSVTDGGRNAIDKGKAFAKTLESCILYNINVIWINHYTKDMSDMMSRGISGKSLPFLPHGMAIPGGEKPRFYSSTVIIMKPLSSKSNLKTDEDNGYNGFPVGILVTKCRTNVGGNEGRLELVQKTGFHPALTCVEYAKENGLIEGRNPNCYFPSNSEVTFDNRKFLEEIEGRPELLRELFVSCFNHLNSKLSHIPKEDMEQRSSMLDIMNDILG